MTTKRVLISIYLHQDVQSQPRESMVRLWHNHAFQEQIQSHHLQLLVPWPIFQEESKITNICTKSTVYKNINDVLIELTVQFSSFRQSVYLLALPFFDWWLKINQIDWKINVWILMLQTSGLKNDLFLEIVSSLMNYGFQYLIHSWNEASSFWKLKIRIIKLPIYLYIYPSAKHKN